MLLEYDFRVVNANAVDHALRGIERRYVQHNARMARVSASGVSGAGSGARRSSSSDPIKAAAAAAARERIAAERKVAREAEQAERRLARQRDSAARHNYRLRQQHFTQLQRQEEQAERRRLSAAEREARVRRRAAEAERRAALRARESFARNTLGTAGRSVRGSTRAIVGAGAATLAIGGGFLVADQVRRRAALERRQSVLAVQGQDPATGQFTVTPEQIRDKVRREAIATGTPQEQLQGGLEGFVARTGDLRGAVENLSKFNTIAIAFDSTTEDIARAAAELQKQFGIMPDQMGDTLAVLGEQGRKASFELKDFATLLPRIAAAAGASGSFQRNPEAVAQLGGFLQIAESATGDPARAATAVEATLRQFGAKGSQLQSGAAFGGRKVEVFQGGDPTRGLNDVQSLIGSTLEASRGNQIQLQKVFGEEGIRAIRPFLSTFREASEAAGGGARGAAAGRGAIEKLFSDNIDAAGDFGKAQADAAKISDTSVAKMQKAMERLETELGDELLPIVVRFADRLAELAPQIGRLAEAVASFAEFLIENPLAGIGGIIATKLVADIAVAAIGQKVAAALTAAIAGKGAVTGAVTGASTAATTAATTATAAAGGGALGAAGTAALAAAAPLAIAATGATIGITRVNARRERVAAVGGTPEGGVAVPFDPQRGEFNPGIFSGFDALGGDPEEQKSALEQAMARRAAIKSDISQVQGSQSGAGLAGDPMSGRFGGNFGATLSDRGSQELTRLREQNERNNQLIQELTRSVNSLKDGVRISNPEELGDALNVSGKPTDGTNPG